jgi:hypothetical protein
MDLKHLLPIILFIGLALLPSQVDATSRFLINCSLAETGTPIAINGSQGFIVNGSAQIVWVQCGQDLYLHLNSSTDYSVINESSMTPVPIEVDVGNGSSYQPSSVWINVGADVVYHFTDNHDSAGRCNLSSVGNVASVAGEYGYAKQTSAGGNPYSSGGVLRNTNCPVLPQGRDPSPFPFTSLITYSFDGDYGLPYGSAWLVNNGGSGSLYGQGGMYSANTHYYMGWGGTQFVNTGVPTPIGVYESSAITSELSRLSSSASLFINGTLNSSNSVATPGQYYDQMNYITFSWMNWNANEWISASFDEFVIYNETKSDAFINSSYQNKIGTAGYGVLEAAGAVSNQTNIAFNNQTPPDITSINLFTILFNASYNILNITGITNLTLYSLTNSSARADINFVNGTAAAQGFTNTSAICSFNDTFGWCTVDDNVIYPGTYNLPEETTDDTPHNTGALGSNSEYLSTQFLNVSNITRYTFFEAMVNGTGGSIQFWYCNSTYAFNTAVSSSPSCAQFGTSLATDPYNHTHTIYSSHIIVPMPVVDGSVSTVSVTPQSYILIRGVTGQTIDYYSLPVTTRSSTTQTTVDGGASWAPQTFTLDSHIHQFDADDTFYYYASADNTSEQFNSTVNSDQLDLVSFPPIPAALVEPSGLVFNGTAVVFAYTSGAAITGSINNYTLVITDSVGGEVFNESNTSANLSFTFDWSVPIGIYNSTLYTCTDEGKCASTYNQFEAIEVTYNLPSNNSSLSGGQVLFNYSILSFSPLYCQLFVNAVRFGNDSISNSSAAVLADTNLFFNTWYVGCERQTDAAFSNINTKTRTVYLSVENFTYRIQISTPPDNVFVHPQSLFYDVNDNLNILYFVDTGGATKKLKVTTFDNNTIVTDYTLVTYNASVDFNQTNWYFVVMRNTNTEIYTTINNNATIFTLYPNGSIGIDPSVRLTGTAIGNQSGNEYLDPYSIAYTKHLPTIDLIDQSFYLFPISNDSDTNYLIRKLNETGYRSISGIDTATKHTTIAENANLTSWLYLDISANDLHIFRRGISSSSDVAKIADSNATYYKTQFNNTIGRFEKYGGKTYLLLANMTNSTLFPTPAVLYNTEYDLSYNFTTKIVNPSSFIFIDENTLIFYDNNNGTFNAFSCYLTNLSLNCTTAPAIGWGTAVPYLSGPLTTSRRYAGSDIVINGIVYTEDGSTYLVYDKSIYDVKFICYDEMNPNRKSFTGVITAGNSTYVISSNVWGYASSSVLFSGGNQNVFLTCTSGTPRRYLIGLPNSFLMSAYSLNISLGAYYSFSATIASGLTIQGARITAYRYNPSLSQYVVVEQAVSDITGFGSVFLQPLQQYRICIDAPGYAVACFDFVPSTVTSITVQLSTLSSGNLILPDFELMWNDVSYYFTPQEGRYNASSIRTEFSVLSNTSSLRAYGYNLQKYGPDGVTLLPVYNNTGSSPIGGILNYTANESGKYYACGWFLVANYSNYTTCNVFWLTLGASQFEKAKAYFDNQPPISGWLYYLIAMICALVAAGYAAKFSFSIAGATGLIVLAGFTMLYPGAIVATVYGFPFTSFWLTTITGTITIIGLYLSLKGAS